MSRKRRANQQSVRQWEYGTAVVPASLPEIMKALGTTGAQGWECFMQLPVAAQQEQVHRLNAQGVLEVASVPTAGPQVVLILKRPRSRVLVQAQAPAPAPAMNGVNG